jgi:hypothetical protein
VPYYPTPPLSRKKDGELPKDLGADSTGTSKKHRKEKKRREIEPTEEKKVW